MSQLQYKDLLDAGVHFGHLTRKWDPRMAPYIFMEKNGIHVIDLNKTINGLDEASNAVKNIVRSGRKVMFVATKKQARAIVADEAARLNMPFISMPHFMPVLCGPMPNNAAWNGLKAKSSTFTKMVKPASSKA